MLEEIKKWYNFSKILKEDMKQIKDEGKFNESNIRRNLLFKYCKQSKNTNFLEECFGKSYTIEGTIVWRFNNRNKYHWVADEIQNDFKNGKVRIKNINNTIKVKFFIVRYFYPPARAKI